MKSEEIDKDCETSIVDILSKQGAELKQIVEVNGIAKLSPKEQIAMWGQKFGALSIADIKDTKNYIVVNKGIALCRSTRSAFEAKRKEDKRFFLEAGRTIDSHYNALIELVEPIEAELQAKKKVIDDQKEAIRLERELKEQELYDNRVKALLETGVTFNGVSFTFQGETSTLSIMGIAIKSANDGQFKDMLQSAKDEAIAIDQRKQEIIKKEQEAAKIQVRHNALIQLGFTLDGDAYRRTNLSSALFGYEMSPGVTFVESCSDEDFDKLTDKAKADIANRDEERAEQEKEITRKQEELAEREKQLAEKERLEKLRIRTNRVNEIKALGFSPGDGFIQINLPHFTSLPHAIDYEESEEAWAKSVDRYKIVASNAVTENDRLFKEAEQLQQKQAEERAKELLKEKEQKAEELRLKALAEEARQPDKAKLKTLAIRIDATEIPEFKSEEAKKIKEDIIERLTDLSAYILEQAEKL